MGVGEAVITDLRVEIVLEPGVEESVHRRFLGEAGDFGDVLLFEFF